MTNMSEKDMSCNQARDLLGHGLARDEGGGDTALDAQAHMHLKQCASCSTWSQQVNEIAAVALNMPQYDVSEAMTQRIVSAIDAEPTYGRALGGVSAVQIVFGLAMFAFMLFEAAEDINGVISWSIGLAIVYGISLLVSSNREVETV